VEYPIEPFVISGEGVLTPPDRDRWVTKEMVTKAGGLPVFTVQQVSEVFFGKSATWLRKRLFERKGRYEPGKTKSGHRRFDLHQIEDLAHMLLEEDAFSPLQFTLAIRMIKSSAIQHLYEIGDTGFLLGHWNGAMMVRRLAVTHLMVRLEELDAGRDPRKLLVPEAERAISEAAEAIRRAEQLPLEEL
jgi:hypothetical protein